MTLSRRQRYSVIVLLVALAALALDKLLLSSKPASALAGVHSEGVAAAGAGETFPSQYEGTAALAERLLERRRARGPLSGGVPTLKVPVLNAAQPDIFSWDRLSGADRTAGIKAARGLNGGRAPTAEEFSAAHQLEATLLGPQPMALIDGRTYRVGKIIDGLVLTAVRAGEAVFVSGDMTVVLSVPSPWDKNESATP